MKNKILGIIPARGKSKDIPRKNLVNLGGKPLIQYTIESALDSHHIDKVIVSTDDEEIAKISRSIGAEIPFIRPHKLAADSTLSIDIMIHALKEMEKIDNVKYNVTLMLQPTTPFRTSKDIDDGIELLLRGGTDSVISVVNVGIHHPLRMKKIINDGWLVNYIDQGFEDARPREQLPPVYIRNGALYITWRNVLLSGSFAGNNCKAFIMPPERSVNISTKFDLAVAEHLLKETKNINKKIVK